MAGDYLEALRAQRMSAPSPVPATAAEGDSPYLNALRQESESRRSQFRAATVGAIDANPDEVARQRRVAFALGRPLAAVEALPEDSARAAKLQEIESATANAPALRQQLSDTNFARVAHDDVPNLSQIERLMRAPELKGLERSALGAITEPIARGFAGARRSLTMLLSEAGLFTGYERRRAEAARLGGVSYNPQTEVVMRLVRQERERERYPIPANIAEGLADLGGAETMGEAIRAAIGNPRAVGEAVLESLAASSPALAAGVAAGIATRNPLGTGIGVGLGSFGLEYSFTMQDVMADKGIDGTNPAEVLRALNDPELMSEARTKGVKRGIPIGLFDGLTAGVAGRILAGAKGSSRTEIASRAAGELGVQAGGGAMGEATAQLVTGEYKPGDILLEALAEMPTAMINVPVNYRHARERAIRAEAQSALIDNMAQVATASRLASRDPDSFEAFVKAAAEDGPVTDVYVDAQVLFQLGVAQQVSEVSPAVAEQIEAAMQSGGQVRIPIEEFAARIAPTEAAGPLLEHLKAEPDGFSRAEATEFMAEQGEILRAEVERQMTEVQADSTFRASQEAVRQRVLTELNAAGRFTPQVNEFNATLIAARTAVRAAQLDMTPEAFFERQMLRVRGQGVGGEVLEQTLYRGVGGDSGGGHYYTSDPEFARNFTRSGRDNEIRVVDIPDDVVFTPAVLPEATNEAQVAAEIENARAAGKKAVAVSEGEGQPPSVFVFDKTAVRAMGRYSGGTFDPNDANILNQSDVPQDGPAVDRLQMVAERGAREMGARSVITAAERTAMQESARALGIPVRDIESAVREHKLAHPVTQGWELLVYNRTVRDDAGKIAHEYQKVSYSFSSGSDGKQLAPGIANHTRRVNAIAQGMVEEVRSIYRRAGNGDKNAQNILAQAGWYKQMRSRLRQEFGGLGDLFADLLGATSPNTPVRDNWTNAVDSLRRASRGDYDALIPQWEAWADRVDALELQLRGFVNTQLEQGLSKKAIKALPDYQAQLTELKNARRLGDDLLPTKESGKKYGFNGRNVARAMVDLWRVVKNADPDIGRGGTAPKALNFSGNLIGFRERATIDVWAARMLQRLAGGRRIPSMAETGVTGEMREDGSTTLQFGFGQDVFSEAVKRIRADAELVNDQRLAEINDDDLQAVVWFVEKELWTVNNWTNAAGEGGSFELEANLTGPADQVQIRALRKALDSSKSTPAAKAAARAELAALERTVDRFVGGLSIQMSMDTQGVDFVPTDADMARLANEIRTAVYEADDGATVLGSKTLSTEGRYGGVERSLDLEVVAREGYDANALWAEMLRQAQATKQDSTFLSRVLREGEDVDYLRHRPGIEVYFRDAAAAQKLDSVLADLAKEGVEFLTVVVDGRRLGETMAGAMPAAVGVRLQYVPEFEQRYGMDDFSGLNDEAITAKIRVKASEMRALAERVLASIDGVSFAGQFWYDTQVAFGTQYQEKIDAISTGVAEGSAGGIGSPQWSGQSVREGLENADRHARETARREPDVEPGDVLGRDALGSGPEGLLEQPARGTFSPNTNTISLLQGADLSTFLHESAHYFFENDLALAFDLLANPQRTAGEQQIVDDASALLRWHGFTGPVDEQLQAWRMLSFEEKRAYHERTAESFEAYLFEGKAPSIELQRPFQQFRAWLTNVYRSLKDFLAGNPEAGTLTDEVRSVFDRMLATTEQIQIAEQARSMMPLFERQDQAGMTPEQFAEYQRLGIDATNEAVQELQAKGLRDMQWLHNARGRVLDKLKKQSAAARREIRAEVRSEVMAEPVYRAWSFLTGRPKADPAEGPAEASPDAAVFGKIATDALSEYQAVAERIKALRMTREDGMHPDVVAEMFEFDSGDQLLRALAEAPPPSERIEALTDARMLEENADLATPEALEREADRAVHNEVRARMVATELTALDRAMNPRREAGTNRRGSRRTVAILPEAAKAFAAEMIARQRIRDIRPGQYTAAETRAANAAAKASKAGETAKAAAEKRNQLINLYAARAAYDAQDEVKAIRESFRKIVTGTDAETAKTRDMDIVNTARAILAQYGYGQKAEGAERYMKSVAAYDPAMAEVLRDRVEGATRDAKPLDQLTVDEVRALHDSVQSLWHLARRSRQIEIDGKKVALETAQNAIGARLNEIGVPDTMPGETSAMTPGEKWLARLKSFKAAATRVESWVGGLDGNVPIGPLRKYVWQPVKEAADRYRADRIQYIRQFRALLEPVAPSMKRGLIAAPELGGYTFGKADGIGMTELLHAILHTGNASNKRKLLLGRNWATERPDGTVDTSRWDAFIARMIAEKRIGKEHFDFAQGVWDLMESTKAGAQATHRDVFGMYFDEVTAEEVTTPFGTYRGGYVPAMADPDIVADAATRALAETENQSLQFAFPTTAKGFTKGRVEYNRPLKLDLRTLTSHIDKVLMFTHLEMPVRSVRRILTSKEVGPALSKIDPQAFDGILTPWLNRAAKQQVEAPIAGSRDLMRGFAILRSRAGMAAMFANVVNTAQQITGFPIAAVKVPPRYIMHAFTDYIRSPKAMTEAVTSASPFMAERMLNEAQSINTEIKDILINPTLFERGQAWGARHAYFMQAAIDNVMSPIVWMAARNQALEQGLSEADANRLGDSMVRETQTSSLPEDISRIESGNAFVRMFTQFVSYFNMQANLLGSEFTKIAHETGMRKGAGKALYVTTLAILIPAVISEMIVQAFRGGPDDEDGDGEYLDDWLAAIFLGTLRSIIALVPVAGPVATAAVNAANNKPYDDRISTSPAISMIESTMRAPFTIYAAMTEDKHPQRAVRDFATATAMLFGLPAAPIGRTVGYMAGVANNDIEPTSGFDMARGLVTGFASPDSK